MPLLQRLLHYVSFGKKDDMPQPEGFEPTDIFKHRYQDPQVLITYVKTLPDRFTDDQIKVKVNWLFSTDVLSELIFHIEFKWWTPWA